MALVDGRGRDQAGQAGATKAVLTPTVKRQPNVGSATARWVVLGVGAVQTATAAKAGTQASTSAAARTKAATKPIARQFRLAIIKLPPDRLPGCVHESPA